MLYPQNVKPGDNTFVPFPGFVDDPRCCDMDVNGLAAMVTELAYDGVRAVEPPLWFNAVFVAR